MSDMVRSSSLEGVAVLEFDNPPVNAVSGEAAGKILAAVRRAEADPAVRAIVLMGAGQNFAGGADINEFVKIAAGTGAMPPLHPIFYAMESASKPIVAAIRGAALGGGLELAMACHYRIALLSAQLGQPETKLGLIPGACGTQRLPRLAGVEKAAEMCAFGELISAADALAWGILDRIVEGELAEAAVSFAKEVASRPILRTRDRNQKLGDAAANALIFETLREQCRKTKRNLEAPLAAIDAIEIATTTPFEEGCRKELEIFVRSIHSDQSKALIHAFFGERTVAKIPGLSKDTPVLPIRKAAVIGAGAMGGGIAMCFANAGIPVRIKEAGQAALDRGMATIRGNYENSVKRGRVSQQAMEERLALIEPQLTAQGLDEADIIVEAVFESLAIKREVFAEIDKVARPGCILATNTSTLDVDAIAGATSRPEMVAGLHFFSPANVMRLVEVVRGAATNDAVIASAMALAKQLKKVGVLVRNGFGFVGNRMMFPYMREAQFLVEEGATPGQVDQALTDFGMAMGIFAVEDLSGIDVMWRIRQEFKHLEKPGARRPLVADKLYELGRYGQKTGQGWYNYDQNRKASTAPEVLDLIRTSAADAGIVQRTFSAEEIVERTVYALINEGARILEEGIAMRAVDIDVIYMNGYGFPAYRGGPMFYAASVGLKKIHDRIRELHAEHGDRWAPAPLLARLAESGEGF